MRSPLARLAVLGAFAVTIAACSGGGNGTTLPFAGPPNNAGGNNGTFQSGGSGAALLRFIQASPDAFSGTPTNTVDVCVDNLPLLLSGAAAVPYGRASVALYSVPGGIAHTIAVYPSQGAQVGAECSTAPGPYLGVSTIAITTIAPAASSRLTIVLGGTAASGTRGLYVFNEPTFPVAPAGNAVISHNAAPAFSIGKSGVGFGTCSTTVTPCATPTALTGAQNVAPAKVSSTLAAVTNSSVTSSLSAVPAGFYDGTGVPAGTPIPITSIVAPTPLAGQPYIVQLYAIDGPAGGLNLVSYVESTLGFGF